MSIYSIRLQSNENISKSATFEMYAISTIVCFSLAVIVSFVF